MTKISEMRNHVVMTQIDVKSIRTARHLTLQEMADEIGVHISTVWRWENGQQPRGAARKLLSRMQSDPSFVCAGQTEAAQ